MREYGWKIIIIFGCVILFFLDGAQIFTVWAGFMHSNNFIFPKQNINAKLIFLFQILQALATVIHVGCGILGAKQ